MGNPGESAKPSAALFYWSYDVVIDDQSLVQVVEHSVAFADQRAGVDVPTAILALT